MLQVNNGSTANVNVTVESQPVADVNTSVYVPAVVKVCAPKVYVSPSMMVALMTLVKLGFTVISTDAVHV